MTATLVNSDGHTRTGVEGWWWAGLLLMVAAVYARAVGFEAIPTWDDGLFVLDRRAVTDWWSVSWFRRLATPEVGYPMPIPTFVFAHVRLLVGENLYPHVLHALNIAVHVGNVVLVGTLATRWSRPALGLAVAALWGLHPICVESVAWLTNLKTLLAATGILSALLCWERAIETDNIRWRLGALLAFLVGLGCRPDSVVFVPIAAALSVWRRGWSQSWRRDGVWLAGLFVMGVLWGLWAKLGHDSVVEYSAMMPGTQSVPIRVSRALELSLRHLVWPVGLDPGYFRDPSAGFVAAIPGIVIGMSLSVVFAVVLWARWYQISFGLFVFGVWYAPFSGIVFLPRFTADTYLYGPAVGMVFAVTAAVDRWLAARRPGEDAPKRWLVCALVALLATGTFVQVSRWQNARTLWEPVIRQQPRVTRPYEQVALYHAKHQQWERAYETIMAGLPVFRASRDYPSFAAAIVDDAGYPNKAAELAMEAVLEDAEPEDLHYKVLLDIFSRRQIQPPRATRKRRVLHRAINMYGKRDDWLSQRSNRLQLAGYLTKYFEPTTALPFIRREMKSRRPKCAVWALARRIEGSLTEHDLPRVPERCREIRRQGE